MLCAYPTLPTIHDGCRQDQKQLHRIIIYSWIRRLSSKPPLKQHLICSFIALLFASWWMLLLLIITAKSRRQFLVSLGLLGVPKFTAGTAFHGSSSNNSHSACFASSDTKSAAAATISSCWNDMPHPIGLGTYMMHRESVATALRSAVQAGYRRIDCAPVYFNEDAIGDALFDITRENIVSRSDLYVVSKLPSPFHRNVEAAVRKTINDLRLDYLDLYLGAYMVGKRSYSFSAVMRLSSE